MTTATGHLYGGEDASLSGYHDNVAATEEVGGKFSTYQYTSAELCKYCRRVVANVNMAANAVPIRMTTCHVR